MTSRNLPPPHKPAALNSLTTYSDFINTINLRLSLILEGGRTISQTEERAKRTGGFICPNASCRKVFAKPLKATNLQQESTEPYDACPYCLTEITPISAIVALSAQAMEESKEQDNAPTQVEAVGNSPECKNHFGFLSERSLKEHIPDECLTCKDIVHCMLKKTME